MARFERLVRFKSTGGQIYYGELGLESTPAKEDLLGRKVQVYNGNLPWDDDFKLSSREEEIAQVNTIFSSSISWPFL
jgi:hypothetical protein